MKLILYAATIVCTAIVSAAWGYSVLRGPIQQGKPIIIDGVVYIAIVHEITPTKEQSLK